MFGERLFVGQMERLVREPDQVSRIVAHLGHSRAGLPDAQRAIASKGDPHAAYAELPTRLVERLREHFAPSLERLAGLDVEGLDLSLWPAWAGTRHGSSLGQGIAYRSAATEGERRD
jgi:hypothetical protein